MLTTSVQQRLSGTARYTGRSRDIPPGRSQLAAPPAGSTVTGTWASVLPRIATPVPSRTCSVSYPGTLDQVGAARALLGRLLDGCPVAEDAVLLCSDSLNLTFCSSCPFWWVAASGGLMGCPGLRWWRFGG